jgi:DNA-binding beta-propeller fold protein YncE
VDPTGQFVYVANNGSNNVYGYMINGTSGALTAVFGSPFPAGSGPQAITVDPTGQFAYVANLFSSSVSAYNINGGSLSSVPGSPFQAIGGPEGVAATGGPTPTPATHKR